MKLRIALAAAVCALSALSAYAHGDAKHEKNATGISSEQKVFGREGDPKKASRTITVDMSDKMRFTPESLQISRGATIKFVVKNSGQVMHEMVLGTMDELQQHAEMMKKNPEMEHEDPWGVHVAPGKSAALVWQFTRPGEFFYGCLIPGHFEAGMIGKVIVK